MHHSERHGINSQQLYGLRKNKSTHEALITLRVIYDLARLDWCHIVSLFNDLKGCYDRIRPVLNTVTARRMGCPEGTAVCHAKAVRQMKHRVRTAFGISQEYITWDKFVNPGGIGQGNGAGPSIWVAVSTPLLEMMRSAGHGVKFSKPLSKEETALLALPL